MARPTPLKRQRTAKLKSRAALTSSTNLGVFRDHQPTLIQPSSMISAVIEAPPQRQLLPLSDNLLPSSARSQVVAVSSGEYGGQKGSEKVDASEQRNIPEDSVRDHAQQVWKKRGADQPKIAHVYQDRVGEAMPRSPNKTHPSTQFPSARPRVALFFRDQRLIPPSASIPPASDGSVEPLKVCATFFLSL